MSPLLFKNKIEIFYQIVCLRYNYNSNIFFISNFYILYIKELLLYRSLLSCIYIIKPIQYNMKHFRLPCGFFLIFIYFLFVFSFFSAVIYTETPS